MRWEAKDIDTYLKAQQYIDTAIVPLVPIAFGSELKSTVVMGEFISIISAELERQFHGRLVLLPAFTYTLNELSEERIKRLKNWHDLLINDGFRHILSLTSDLSWKEVEQQLSHTLLAIPSIPLEHLDKEIKTNIVSDQIKQLALILTNKWQNE